MNKIENKLSQFLYNSKLMGYENSVTTCEKTMCPILIFKSKSVKLQYNINITDFFDFKNGVEVEIFNEIYRDLIINSRGYKINKILNI
jgi:hypothetical protein